MRWVAWVVLAGCGASPRAPLANTASPEARLAIADGATVRIVRAAHGALTVEQTAKVPDTVGKILWVGANPAVWIRPVSPERGLWQGDEGSAAHVNEMGFVTPGGYVAFGPVTWPPQPRPKDEGFGEASEADSPDLIAIDGTLWQRHCAWHAGPDGGGCVHWTSARRVPEPLVISEADFEPYEPSLPKLAAPLGITIEHTTRKRDDGDDGHEILRCTAGAHVTEFPPAGSDLDGTTVSDPTWIGARPPIALVATSAWAGVGMPSPDRHTILEGCEVSTRFTEAVPGPGELVAVFGPNQLAIYQHGALVGALDVGGTAAVFAP